MDMGQLRKLYAEKLAAAKALANEYKGKEAEMSQEVIAKINTLLGEADELKVKLDLAQRMGDASAFLSEPAGEPKAAFHGFRESAPDEGNTPVDGKAWRSVKVATIGGAKEIRFNVPLGVQRKEYPAAFEAYLRFGKGGMGPTDLKTLSEGSDSAGGFLVPEDFQTEIIKKIATDAMIRSRARVIQTSRDIVSWPRINYTTDNKYTSGVRLTWTGETPATSTTHRVTDPVFGEIKIPVHTAMASLPLTNVLIEDAAFDVTGIASTLLGEAFTLGEDDVFINGTGSAQPMGILTQVGGNGPAATTAGSTSTLGGEDVINLFYDVPAQYRRRAAWLMNSATLKTVESIVDTNGRYLVQSLVDGSLQSPQVDTLRGQPILVDEFMPDIASAAYPVLYGDLSAYMIVDRVGFSVQRLSELYAETDITLLLARKRVGGYTVEPWRLRALKMST